MNDSRNQDINRRGMLECMGWTGTGALYTLAGGIFSSISLDAALAAPLEPLATASTAFTFLQISDSHIGFNKAANPDARATYREAIAKVQALTIQPDFILHTGDITHLSRDVEFDDAEQILKETGLPAFHVPGEHDWLDDSPGKAYLARFGKDTNGSGWYSFDHSGVHFVALNNVASFHPGGLGHLGDDQLAWLAKDLAPLTSSTPVVVLAHIPMWTIYAEWGWGTDDGAKALSYLRRFGSVTVLNGHIHQIIQKIEGNISFHTARATAYPQPAPGTAPSPGPMTVPTEKLHSFLGIRTAKVQPGSASIALIEETLV